MAPPTIESVIASSRNCSRTCRPLAPIAMRMPISRVRSVTETSMMFMMPMPPTSSEMAAAEPSRMRQGLRRSAPRSRRSPPASASEVGSPGRAGCGGAGAAGRRSRSAPPATCVGRARPRSGPWSMPRRALELLHHRGVRGDDLVVLILPHHVAALRLEHADHLERDVLDADRSGRRRRPAGKGCRPPWRRGRRPSRRRGTSLSVKNVAVGHVPGADERPVDAHALDRGPPVRVAGHDLRGDARPRARRRRRPGTRP